jgi:hypothetical protein
MRIGVARADASHPASSKWRGVIPIALRKIDIVNWKTAVAQQFNIHSILQVNVYDRSGRLVGTVLGVDFGKVKSYVAQAKSNS